MILPTKHIKPRNSIIWVGTEVLQLLEKPKTINTLWNEVKEKKYMKSFGKFILTLDFLFMLELITYEENFIIRDKS